MTDPIYSGFRRRAKDVLTPEEAADPAIVFYDMLAQHNESILRMESAWASMIETITEAEQNNKSCRDKFLMAFPDGDHEAHRRLHEAEIKRVEARAKFWTDIGASAAKWGILGALGWVSFAIWHETISSILSALGKK